MAILVYTQQKNHPQTGIPMLVATHGQCLDSGKRIQYEGEMPEELGAVYEHKLGEFIIHH